MSTLLAGFPVPTGREEAWRFTPLDRLHDLHVSDEPLSGIAIHTTTTGCQSQVVDRALLGDYVPVDRVAELGWRSTDSGVLITVPRNATGAHAAVDVSGTAGSHAGHIRIVAEAFSDAIVVIRHTGYGDAIVNVDIEALDGSRLTVVSVQEWGADAVHLGHHAITVGRDASVRHVVVSLGGSLVRLLPTVRYTAPGGSAELLGVFLSGAGQHLEHRLHVEHVQPHCRSNVAYKGALSGDGARSVWIGDVLVRKDAIGTDTYELNRNLLLTEGARADSVPNLELETGEITGAGHASATGRFDDDQLFYLQARGIPADVARMLVVRGFLVDIIARIGSADVESALLAAVDARLEVMGMASIEDES